MKSVRLLSCLLITAVLATGCIQAQTHPEMCTQIENIVEKEIKGKTSQDSTILFVAAKNKDDAFKQAQDLCIKLQAKPSGQEGQSTIYTLPEENGNIKLLDMGDDECLYFIQYLKVHCESYPLKEVRYVRLKCYRDQGK